MNQKLLLSLLILLLALLGGVLWQVSGGSGSNTVTGLEFSGSLSPEESDRESQGLPEPGALSEPVRVNRDLTTTVVLPLELEFELVDAAAKLDDERSPAMGSASTAKLRGSIHDSEGRGVVGYVEFIAGPNRGRVIDTNSEGLFGANDLLAGLSLVALRGRGIPGAEREVLLREQRETQLNVGFGRPAVIRGVVRDKQNNGIPTATVVMDGQETKTDEQGRFYFGRMASGKVPIYISKPGFATQREMQFITAGMSMPTDTLKYTLRKAATLKVIVPERVGTSRPGQLFISGRLDGTGSRNYPWHLKSPVSLFGGESIEIEDLAPGPVRLQYFRAGAQVTPAVIKETLVAGQTRTVTFHLKSAPTLVGVVKSGDRPAEGALVRLEVPDVTGASARLLGSSYGRVTIEMDVLSQMPPAVQSLVTGVNGEFQFSSAEDLSEVRYLTAKSQDGKAWAGRILRKGDLKVELQLEEARTGRAGFSIETTERFQALPVRYVVNGKPSYVVLAPGERLEIPELPEGHWKFSASWGGEVITRDVSYQLEEVEELFVPLPAGAVDGQPKELRDAMQ